MAIVCKDARLTRRGLLTTALAVAVAPSLPAFAHHGWSWAEGKQMELKGTIQKISMAPPHPTLMVAAADGVVWLVELGNPTLTARSGFTAKTAKPGEAIVVLGNRHKDQKKAHMKAVRITIAGRAYDIYPERIGAN
ncbi:MAG TPA: DUF6152 family protein [Bradyrhizobium sp.]|nr:DUF6152 family protein [Bradyrhizobium sp.]